MDENQIISENSTAYLASTMATKRTAEQNKNTIDNHTV